MDEPAGPPPMMATSKSGFVITNACLLRIFCHSEHARSASEEPAFLFAAYPPYIFAASLNASTVMSPSSLCHGCLGFCSTSETIFFILSSTGGAASS